MVEEKGREREREDIRARAERSHGALRVDSRIWRTLKLTIMTSARVIGLTLSMAERLFRRFPV